MLTDCKCDTYCFFYIHFRIKMLNRLRARTVLSVFMLFAFNIYLHLSIMHSNIQCFWIKKKRLAVRAVAITCGWLNTGSMVWPIVFICWVTWQNSMHMKSSLTEISTHSLGDGQLTATLQECVWSCSVTGLLILCVWDVLLEWAAGLFTLRRWAVQINGAVHEKRIWNFRYLNVILAFNSWDHHYFFFFFVIKWVVHGIHTFLLCVLRGLCLFV